MLELEGERIYSVSEVTAQVKAVLESSLPVMWVEGEVSNFVHHTSGHMYFTLKDEKSQLSCVMFKSANRRLSFSPENGIKVAAWGRIKVYEPSGRYQLYVEAMKPAGLGALAAAFEKLRRRLAEEGLFDAEHKKSIPRFPGTIAVVTSPTGAAVRDVIRVAAKRYPSARLVVVPTRVQGPDAANEIVEAVRAVDVWRGADVAIVGRGGGSLEDLWAFNEEVVARAIFEARTPIVSAVGHEIDMSISDFVADLRAATPSNAAELVTPDREELARSLGALAGRLRTTVETTLEGARSRAEGFVSAYAFRLPAELVERLAQRTDELTRRLASGAVSALTSAGARLEHLTAELRLADPSHIMARGFAAVSLLPGLSPVRSAGEVSRGSDVRVTVTDGFFDCEVRDVTRKKGRRS